MRPRRQDRGNLDRLVRRHAERDRIADELHDTLLQGIHGLIWKFQALAERLPPGHSVRAGMDDALQAADRVLVEGRDRVLDLRAGDDDGAPLLLRLKRAVEEVALDPAVHLTATSRGDEFELTPRVHSEVIAIAADALRHAYRHSSARSIELLLSFEKDELRVCIAHDGTEWSTDSDGTRAAPGRWGLARLHERASSISSDLRIARGTEGGSVMELSVPGSIAFGLVPQRRSL
jgi:signal transduction histidine kinase